MKTSDYTDSDHFWSGLMRRKGVGETGKTCPKCGENLWITEKSTTEIYVGVMERSATFECIRCGYHKEHEQFEEIGA